MTIFSNTELKDTLSKLHDWHIIDAAIERTFVFDDFKQAIAFIIQVGILAEQADHHPEINNVYNKVVLRLNTHSANAITNKDTELAAAIETLKR